LNNILVTGCAGFIGKYLVRSLLEDGNNFIHGVDRNDNLKKMVESDFLVTADLDRFNALPIDLTSQEQCKNLPQVDFVYHLAAINGTSLFYKIPWDVFYNSSVSTINLIDRYKDFQGLKRFIYTSSSEVYSSIADQNSDLVPSSENIGVGFQDILNPRWSYGGAKLAGELALIAAYNQFKIPFSIVRFHNVYGPEMGIDHVIPDFIARARKGRFELFGADNLRSFIFISDAIAATKMIAVSAASLGKIIHVGTMDSLSMSDLAKKIMHIGGWVGEILEEPAPVGSTASRCPETSFLNREVGFIPKISLEEGLSQILDSSH